MKSILKLAIASVLSFFMRGCDSNQKPEAVCGWQKYERNPVLGDKKTGTIFDIFVLKTDSGFVMYSSWRPQKSIAIHYSDDGKKWSAPKIVLPNGNASWESNVNRPCVVFKDGVYHMWYTGQEENGTSRIGYATSNDGENFTRNKLPVLVPSEKWEGIAVMCPHVNYDEADGVFQMWYSAGDSYEPNAIGYATSKDGVVWEKLSTNPIFMPSKDKWMQDRVTACQVIKRKNDYLMFFIGFEDVHTARIGMARSRDGIHNYELFSGNPIIRSGGKRQWDADAVYKPFAIFNGNEWLLWYNGRIKNTERIGLAIHSGEDLGF